MFNFAPVFANGCIVPRRDIKNIFAQFPDRISTSNEKDEQQRITIGATLYAQTSNHKLYGAVLSLEEIW